MRPGFVFISIMKTFAKLVGGFFALLFLAAGVFYVGWLIPPDAEDVCDHVEELSKQAGVEAKPRNECLVRYGTPPEYGKMPWVKWLKCVEDAPSLEGVRECRDTV
ncbi:MAG: hypothetical protein ACE37F_29500 [Nannocystaceae bacterium]|nr:hypothetical protein [bacterium]